MSEIEVSVSDGVGVVTLTAPERRNALTVAMAAELAGVCDALDDDSSVGAVVVLGRGGYFCAGAHRDIVTEASRDPSAETAWNDIETIYRSFARVSQLTVPSIAALRGGAVGAGVNLLLACDLRIVAEDASIEPGFRQLGLHPGGGHLALLHRLVGYEATVAMGIFGAGLTGRRAHELGMAWEAVGDDDVETRAMALARVAGSDPVLSRLVAGSLSHEVGPPPISLSAAIHLERAAQMRTQRRLRER